MKKILIVVFLSFSIFSYSKEFWEKSSFNVNIIEKSKINNKIKNKEYLLEYGGDKMKLTISSPNINKGEVYTFSGNEKTVYYPSLKQTITQRIGDNEVSLLQIFNMLKGIKNKKNLEDKDVKFIFEKGVLKEVNGRNYKVEFLNYKKSGDYNYPSKIKVTMEENVNIDYSLNNFK